jgi:inorganic pyrophosphatase
LFHRRRAPFRAASTTTIGTPGSEDFRVFFTNNGKTISPWHDIPLRSGENYNVVIEIPKFTKAKMEISTKEPNNPIAQDRKNGKLRDYHGPIYWNYGAFPQTWEDPNVNHPIVNAKGDNDPLDLVEIGSESLATGSVHEVRPTLALSHGFAYILTCCVFRAVQVKVLGVLAMVDDGELDWKVVTIRTQDELAPKLNDISDVEKHCPGVVTGKSLNIWLPTR